MSVPRLAIVRQKYNAAGGAERFVSRVIEALQGQVDVTLIARQWNQHGGQATIRVRPFYIGNVWRDWGFACAVRAVVRAGSFDLVQSHERIPGLPLYRAGDGVHAEWLIQRARVQSPLKRMGRWLNPYHHYLSRAERRMFEHGNMRAVICVSELVKQDILRHFRIDPAKLHVIYNGIDTAIWSPALRSQLRVSARASFGLTPDETVLAFVGSGFERKGVGVAIQALARGPQHVRLLVAGKDKHQQRYEALAAELGVANRVTFLGSVDDVRPVYAAADACILPTLYEPFGNVILEAMAMGLPVLTTHTAGAAEWIRHGENGFVMDALDVAGFAQAIAQVSDPGLAASMGERARETVAPHTPAAMTEKLVALYRRLLPEN